MSIGLGFLILMSFSEAFLFYKVLSLLFYKLKLANRLEASHVSFLTTKNRFNKDDSSDNFWFLLTVLKVVPGVSLALLSSQAANAVSIKNSTYTPLDIINFIFGCISIGYAGLYTYRFLFKWWKVNAHSKPKLFSEKWLQKMAGLAGVVLFASSILAGAADYGIQHFLFQKTNNKTNFALYNSQKEYYAHLASTDASLIQNEIAGLVSNYTSFGDAPGNITIKNEHVVFDPMVNATGIGSSVSTTGPESSSTKILTLSPGASLYSANYGPGKNVPVCLVVTSNGTYVKYTNNGKIVINLRAPIQCVNGR